MSRDADDPDRPSEPTASDVDAAFAQIVAGWDAGQPQWPADADGEGDSADRASADRASADRDGAAGGEPPDDSTPTEEIPAAGLPLAVEPVDEDDDHFVPPEPPPLPRPQPATVGAVLLVALGIVLLWFPHMIGFSEQYGLPLGLLSITGAIAWLVTRLRQGPPTDSGWDDGAQV